MMTDTLAALDAAIAAGRPVTSGDVLEAADRVGELARALEFADQVAPHRHTDRL